eukprot:5212677-Pleurochrysis_carterae.AAC.1
MDAGWACSLTTRIVAGRECDETRASVTKLVAGARWDVGCESSFVTEGRVKSGESARRRAACPCMTAASRSKHAGSGGPRC